MKNDLLSAWWNLVLSASDIAWTAPWVIQKRSSRMMRSPGLFNEVDRREATRMIVEKVQAAQEAQWVLWRHTLASQQDAWSKLWTRRLSQSSLPSAAALKRAATDSTILAHRVLQPARRRVKANARRLRKRR